MDLAFRDMDLSEATRMPIIMLYDHGAAMRQKELAEALAVDSSSLFRILNALRMRDLIDWEADPADRRAKLIRLTASGRAIAQQILDRSLAIERQTLAGLRPHDLATTRALLKEMVHRLETLQIR